jgi:dipeptidyl aminopeptidase/acylaminoacyl peptidase
MPSAPTCERLKSLKRNVLALFLAVAGPCLARPLATPTDLWVWRTAADPRINPDGTWVVYIEGWSDPQREASYSNLRLNSSDGRQHRAFTQGQWRDRAPRWSPDSQRIAWISDRNGKPQLWLRRMDANQDTALATLQQPLTVAWSPDGNSIAFTAAVPSQAVPPAWAPPAILALLEPRARVTIAVFVVPAAGGAPRRLGDPRLDFVGEPAWMPSGHSILCAEKGGEIFTLRVADGGASQLTREGQVNRDPVPSPDGIHVAYTAAAAGPEYYALRSLRVMNADGSRDRQLAGTLGRDVRHPQWSNDSRTVYFIADDRGATHVYAARNEGTVRQLTNRAERLRGFSLADNGRAVTVRSSATEGAAVFTFATDVPAGGWTLIDVDQELLAGRDWGTVEELPFESAGKSMQAWLVKPPHFDPTRKYPLVLDIQEPRQMAGVEFQLRQQILTAAGFVVLRANPRGTPGYGEEFGNLLDTQIPGDPADDLLRAVDAAVSKGYIDAHHVSVLGGPLAVALGARTGRFAAAVTHHLTPGPMDTTPFSGGIKTPTLVIAGPEDPASELLFIALQKRHVDSVLLRLPLTPPVPVLALQSTLAWLTR